MVNIEVYDFERIFLQKDIQIGYRIAYIIDRDRNRVHQHSVCPLDAQVLSKSYVFSVHTIKVYRPIYNDTHYTPINDKTSDRTDNRYSLWALSC